jgi:MFS family permease
VGTPAPAAGHEPSPQALAYAGFRRYWAARFLTAFATQVLSVSVAWRIYDLTHDPFLLGLVGLVQFAPAPLLVLVTGAVADRFNRRHIMAACLAVEAACAAALLVMLANTDAAAERIWPVFAVLAVFGVARAFIGPVIQSLVSNLVPPIALPSAIAYNSSSFQFATITGPVAGGLLYGVSPAGAFATAAAFFVAAAAMALAIPRPERRSVPAPVTADSLLDGFRYIWSKPLVLGAMSLDLVAVLLGGATALLPVFARDVLETGPWGLGLLRSATGIGALAVSFYLMRHPIRDHAGRAMLTGVVLFGAAITVFGLSTSVWLSVAALAVMGGADMVSVFVRQTLIQLHTPDEVRGRVSAVNMTFIGASNELGEFRAGSMAALIGAVPAVVFGGLGTMLAVAVWMRLFPELKAVRRLDRMPMERT